jgi:hypothetical protein
VLVGETIRTSVWEYALGNKRGSMPTESPHAGVEGAYEYDTGGQTVIVYSNGLIVSVASVYEPNGEGGGNTLAPGTAGYVCGGGAAETSGM